MRTYCPAQATLLNVLGRPKWEGNPKKREYMYTFADSLYCAVETKTTL